MAWKSEHLKEWLSPERSGATPYWHLRLRERPENRDRGIESLASLVEKAHEDTLNWLERLSSDSLDPLANQADGDETAPVGSNYPHELYTTTLQGYLGEIFAGLIAENFDPMEMKWEVPVFLFRNHEAAIHHLEARRLLGVAAKPVPGRFGNDCLAFARRDGQVEAFLTCEGKCTHDHNASMIAAGHEQLSANDARLPVDLLQLLGILESRAGSDASQWVAELSPLLTLPRSQSPRHCDLFVYVCGRERKDGEPWMATTAHAKYESDRQLEAAELRLADFDDAFIAVYPGHVISRSSGD